jgi:bifunctional non-homologous end joining protein LigD
MAGTTSGGLKRDARTQLAEYRRKRDFKRTAEPSGEKASTSKKSGRLRFVIQKHAASRLHFDLRLELDGVMKSWAVPKGPSLDPSVKRLAMQVEDHPIDYNTFEGTIPKGEYGGGTVMLWDRGTYSSDAAGSTDEVEDAIRDGLSRGDLKITFHGERLRGSFALIRMKFARDGSSSSKPQWLLIKHRDEFATEGDVVAANMTSVDSGLTMEEIASGKSRVWNSNREPKAKSSSAGRTANKRKSPSPPEPGSTSAAESIPASLEPMYASVGSEIPGEGWTFEPKYDGIRVLAYATAAEVKLMTRNGKDKAAQFPEIVAALKKLAAQTKRSLVLDGEIVALSDGEPARFQELQSRMHVKEVHAIERYSSSTPAALILFDILADGEDDILIREPWSERRARLVKRVGKRVSAQLRVTESVEGDGKKMLNEARRQGWEGIIAKRTDSRYEPGNRSRNWLKLKIEFRQEFVVGGFTDPRNSRAHIGALLLGYFDKDRFIYVGHTGGGFTQKGLEEMYRRLKPLERKTSPFEETPKTNEKAHWVKPEIVVEVKFNEWTADRRLRQPIFLGVRDDKDPEEVGLEQRSVQKTSGRAGKIEKRKARPSVPARAKVAKKTSRSKTPRRAASPGSAREKPDSASIHAQLTAIQEKGGEGSVDFGGGKTLKVSNLDKVFFPKEKYTKGDVMRYYTRVAEFILPTIEDRPLVLKRFPNGIDGESFYQQKASDTTPAGVRVENIVTDGGEKQPRYVGADLLTLLYTIQLGAISVDPWHSRIQSLEYADYTIIDLDPGPRTNFERVIQVARWTKEVIDGFGLHAAIKTSGSRGLHIYLPLPPSTPNEAATLVAQMIATKVSQSHPKEATIERFVKARGGAMVYVDYLQNIGGKTVAGPYCVRAKPGATVSTPLEWSELTDDLDPRDFSLENAPERFEKIGDIWNEAMRKKNSLRALLQAG